MVSEDHWKCCGCLGRAYTIVVCSNFGSDAVYEITDVLSYHAATTDSTDGQTKQKLVSLYME